MTDGQRRIRVLLVDDHALFRNGVASLFAAEPDFEVVGQASNGRDAAACAKALVPDLILMDVSMPERNGLEATRAIKQALPDVRIVMLTISEEDQDLFEAIKSGAQGYLLKKIAPEALLDKLRAVMRGETQISGSIAGKILGELSRLARHRRESEAALSVREKEVLQFVAEGKSNKEIASLLSVAENTVKNHLKNILEKLHLQNRVQAATYAIRRGLAQEPPKDPSSH